MDMEAILGSSVSALPKEENGREKKHPPFLKHAHESGNTVTKHMFPTYV